MPVYKIHHITRYEYDSPVKESISEIKLYPYPCPEQQILQQDIMITGSPRVEIYADYWGNDAGVFNLLALHQSMTIESRLLINIIGKASPGHISTGFDELQQEVSTNIKLWELSVPEEIRAQQMISEIIVPASEEKKSVAETISYFSSCVFQHFRYIKGVTDIETTVDEIFRHRSGVCQDFAHVLLQLLRTVHIPARYVSGYICPNKNGMRGEGATHAWVEAWIPGHGWAGIDPTNNMWVTDTHVKLSVGRFFKDCTPVKGTFKGTAQQTLSLYVSVGYEDGSGFEQPDNIKMEVQSSGKAGEKTLEPVKGQQQQ
jgi:transglutaminase-like putative cysteine protease